MIPQTWENNRHKDRDTQCLGDNDPLDIVELGTKTIDTCSVKTIKVLGALCLLDQEELDWKILCINIEEAQEKRVR